jgi:hypothetical protein
MIRGAKPDPYVLLRANSDSDFSVPLWWPRVVERLTYQHHERHDEASKREFSSLPLRKGKRREAEPAIANRRYPRARLNVANSLCAESAAISCHNDGARDHR